MTLEEMLRAHGMTPPPRIIPGRWLRFPGVEKGRTNRAGWCRLISPTMAIFGDWSTGLSEIWRDDAHQDDEVSRQALRRAREREVEFLAAQRTRQSRVAHEAGLLLERSLLLEHPYLVRKGFAGQLGFVTGTELLVPMRDVQRRANLVNLQRIAEDGTKLFMAGGRAKGCIYPMGSPSPRHTVLCEGYATGLSIDAAMRRLSPEYAVIVCFSASNLEVVARHFPCALVAADNDQSGVGERCARATGLKWVMPKEIGSDFNDLHVNDGIFAVIDRMRELMRAN